MNPPNIVFKGRAHQHKDNFKLTLVAREIARHNPDYRITVFDEPRDDDGVAEWSLRITSVNGCQSHDLRHRLPGGGVLLDGRIY